MYHMYLKDGKVAFEEVAGSEPVMFEGIPDKNPMGCQKGAAWSRTLYGQERVLHPLRRVGERGEGKWEQVSWDEALEDIAEHILDAIQEAGPETIVHEMTPAEGGTMAVWPTQRLLVNLLGGVATDVNAVINDFQPGHYITWGKFNPTGGAGSEARTKLRLIWHCNPVYTQIPNYHAVAEARYQGCEVIHIAPDAGPSSIHADYFFSVRPGTDAALALGMCRTIIEERLFNERFVTEQTDLPLLVRLDTKRFLRESDIEDGGSDEQFYAWDTARRGIAKAPKSTLRWGRVKPALDARRRRVQLKDGSRVEVTPAFALLREQLNRDYTPEKASEACGVNADVIRSLARKVASKRTSIFMGMNLCKYYHGDLMQRAMLLLLALTSNWGRLGSGISSWSPGSGLEGQGIFSQKQRPGLAETRRVLAMRARLQEMMAAQGTSDSPEIAAIDGMVNAARAGHDRNGSRRRSSGTTTAAIGSGGTTRSGAIPPCAAASTSTCRRPWTAAGGRAWSSLIRTSLRACSSKSAATCSGGSAADARHLLEHLWPKLKLIVSVDWRMSTTGRFSDYVLPAVTALRKAELPYGECRPAPAQVLRQRR